jgi:hypothetical protein
MEYMIWVEELMNMSWAECILATKRK